MKSMTGYGRSRTTAEHRTVDVEIRSWNHKGFDCQIRMPPTYAHIEIGLREKLSCRAGRGKAVCQVLIFGESSDRQIHINERTVTALVEPLRRLSNTIGVPFGLAASDIISIPGALDVIEEPMEAIVEEIHKTFDEALGQWDRSRHEEGSRHRDAIFQQIAALSDALAALDLRRGEAVKAHHQRLRDRIRELIDATGGVHDDRRLEFELAMLAEKSDVEEEIVRARAHLENLRKLARMDRQKEASLGELATIPAGAELGFILQELLRETNTIGSKSQDLEMVQQVIAAKKAIDRMKELGANVV